MSGKNANLPRHRLPKWSFSDPTERRMTCIFNRLLDGQCSKSRDGRNPQLEGMGDCA